ncbi:MAG: Ig domain-containing protein, partial [Lachnospiraceae bacterium]|nr:Ig domain-containing protein [Lachnospiraceae bacterium]
TENGEEDTTEWSYVYFGSYPQSEVTDEATKQAIDSAISQGKGQSAGTAESSEGTDVWVNGTKYRRISKFDTNNSEYFDDVSNNGYRYFKWERIKWKVLNNDGSNLFVVADKAIDCKEYNEEYVNITWETSTIRNWLNNSFYNTAFSSSEQGAIVTQNVVNEDNPSCGTEGGNNTSDKIYLLSISEVTNETYGFCSDYSTFSASRWVQPSNYAHARGASTYNDSNTGGNDNCWWWLRSTGYSSYDAARVYCLGYVDWIGFYVITYNDGVCPALHINLSSDIWSMVDDGTSGEGGNDGNAQNPGGNTPQPGKDTPQSGGNTQNQPVKVTKLTITAPSKKLAAGKKVKLTLKAEPENALDKTVTWKTSNAKYATVDKKGKVSLKAAGAGKTVTITATANDGSGKKASVKLKIMKHAVKSIKLKASGKTLKAGKSMTVKATVKTTGSNANKTLKWTSSNSKYATVSKSGKVTAKKAGKGKTVTITATATDGSNKKAKVKIKIQ